MTDHRCFHVRVTHPTCSRSVDQTPDCSQRRGVLLLSMLCRFIWVALACCLLDGGLAAPAPAPGPSAFYQRSINGDCVNNLSGNASASNGGTNYYPSQFFIQGNQTGNTSQSSARPTTVTVAQDFDVQYFDNYKVVRNLLVNETYVLYQCGTQRPPSSSLPAGAKLFSVPLTSVAVLETVPIAFLTELGVMSRAQSASSYAVGACGQAVLSCGKTAVDSLSLNASTLQTQVQPYTDGIITSTSYANAATTFAFSATSDPGALNRAEWVKFLGMFFNLDSVSTSLFNAVNASYYSAKAGVTPASPRPVMAFVDLYSYSPDTAYEVSLAAYKVQYTRDAGAIAPNISDLLAINGTILSPNDITNSTVWFAWNSSYGGFPSQAAASAAFHTFLQGVNIIVDETFATNPTRYNLTTFLTNMNISSSDGYTFLRNRTVYREDGLVSPAPAYGLDWFEGAIASPDKVLQDFIHAVNPSNSSSYQPIWIRNIARGENVTITSASSCSQITSCTQEPAPLCPLVRTCGNGSLAPQQNATSTCQYAACTS